MRVAANELPTDHVLVREVLGRISNELRRSTAAIERLEETISDLVFAKAGNQSDLRVDLQNVDLVRQELAALADFVAGLAPTIDGRALVDIAPACGMVTLHALVGRLRASSHDDPVAADGSDDHDWFQV